MPLALSLMLFGTALAAAGEARPLPAAQCLLPDRAVDWGAVDEHRLVVRSLKAYYLIETAGICPDLQRVQTVVFQPGPTGRVCGAFGEHVVTAQHRCRIASVQRIDAAAFEAFRNGLEPRADAAH